jgi:hypothetical protein
VHFRLKIFFFGGGNNRRNELRKKGEVDGGKKIPIGQTPLVAHPTRVRDIFTKRSGGTTGYTGIFYSTEKTHRPDTVRCASD